MKLFVSIKDKEVEYKGVKIKYAHHEIENNNTNHDVQIFFERINISQLQALYREKYEIPFIEEIEYVLDIYGVTPSFLSKLFGLGINVIKEYLKGNIPSFSVAQMIRIYKDPQVMEKLISRSAVLNQNKKETLLKKIEGIKRSDTSLQKLNSLPSRESGFSIFNIKKFQQMIFFFAKEKINISILSILLFYADFGNYKLSVKSISGFRYFYRKIAIPENYFYQLEILAREGMCEIGQDITDNFIAPVVLCTNVEFEPSNFSKRELSILNLVLESFNNLSDRQVYDFHVKDKEVLINQAKEGAIDYQSAFFLSFPKIEDHEFFLG